jgi:tRNA pseudouridine32 synthase/23S rRNA pseudouridine746 synthase
MVSANKIVLRTAVALSSPVAASAFLCGRTGLSKVKVKDAMNKGALWVKRKNKPMRRLRRASALLMSRDRIEFYFDERLLSLVPPDAACIADVGQYSVWFKPAGLLSQGTRYGDHCSLVRRAELFFRPSREVFSIHRLDREVAGLMLLAHTREAAARLSELLRQNLIVKKYRVEVLGRIAEKGQSGSIDLPLDGRPSRTCFKVLSFHPEKGTSSLEVTISTGRLHQIRRHLEMVGCPVMGDPRYGRGNKNQEGMKLRAVSLKFRCPFQGSEREFSLR